jgi:hypothetical protein
MVVLVLAWTSWCGAAVPVVESAVPREIYVEAGRGQSWLILRGKELGAIRELRSVVGGKTTDHVVGRPAPVQDGMREFVLLARPDAARGPVALVALTPSGPLALDVRVLVVEPGDPRAKAAAKAEDLSRAAREARGQSIVVDQEQLPQVRSTVPSPLRVAPNGRPVKILLQGANLERVTDVRIRKEGEPPRYRGRQGQLTFRRVSGGLEVELVASPRTPMGTRYQVDLLVEEFRAWTVPLEIGDPPPPAPPQVETREPGTPRVIELPPMVP